jgi:CHAT domain-containing protein/tetratricopeptide (TPR) repeat protein
MPHALLLLLALALQAPVSLDVGKPVHGELGTESAQVHSPTLDVGYSDFPTVGQTFAFTVPETGSYSVELTSDAFDTYLILQNSDGKLLTEDDDGLFATHSRVAGKFRAEKQYQVVACALHGERGKFQIELRAGPKRQFSPAELMQLEEEHLRNRLLHLESVGLGRSEEAAFLYDDLSLALEKKGELGEVGEFRRRSLSIREEVLDPADSWIGISLNSYAMYLKKQGRYEEALPLYQRAIQIAANEFGPDELLAVKFEGNLGELYRAMGEFEKSRKISVRKLGIFEKAFGPTAPELLGVLNSLGGLHQNLGEYSQAQEMFERAVAICEKSFAKDNPDSALYYNNLALVLQERGNYAEALALNLKAADLREKAYGKDHPELGPTINNLGLIYNILGDLPRARASFERALQIAELAYGKDHLEVAKILLNLAHVVASQGFYNDAVMFAERSLRIAEFNLGDEHPLTARCLEGLAIMLLNQRDVDRALPLMQKVLLIQEQIGGQEFVPLAATLINLAQALQSNDDCAAAEPLLKRALDILQKVHGPKHTRTAAGLNALAVLYFKQKNYAQALIYAQDAMEAWTSVLGPNHSDTALSMNRMGTILRSMGEHEAGIDFHQKALGIYQSTLGADSLQALRTLIQLGNANREIKKPALAHQCYLDSISGLMKFLDRELPSMDEAARLRLMKVTASPEKLIATLSQLPGAETSKPFALYQQWKGKATRLQAAGAKLAHASQDQASLKAKGQIQMLAKELSELVLLPVNQQNDDHKVKLQALRESRLTLERELNRKLGLDQLLAMPTVNQVQQGLPTDSVLVDFFVGEEVYAWILRASGAPELILLGEAKSLRALQSAFLHSTVSRGGKGLSNPKSNPGTDLLARLWQPLQASLGGASTIFICPDGFLCELPFGILPQVDGSYLLEKHNFLYLTDPTRPGWEAESSNNGEGPLLAVGGVNYFRRDDLDESMGPSTLTRSRMANLWSSLPGTRDEMQTLRDLHDYILEWEAPMTVVEGKAATEERIRSELPKHSYIHIATHGYFEPDHLPSLLLDAEEQQTQASLEQQVKAVGLLPGLLSGMVFAGVNGEADASRDDGYLSAEEIQHLDLSGCGLVVLSACETALGSSRAGEGLMSLRRAFSVAGADTVISSLWKVDDVATAQLMKDFYTNLWEKNMSRGAALQEAKLRMLRRNRIDNSGDAMPSTWGAFVLSGDWK